MKTKFLNAAALAALAGYGNFLDARVMKAEGILPVGAQLARHGDVALCNDTLFQQAEFNQPLTDFAVAFKDSENLEAELNFAAPPRRTTKRFTYRAFENAEAFLLDDGDNDIREIGGNFNELEQLHSSENESRVFNKGFAMRVDKDQVEGDANWQERHVGHIRTRLLRCDLRRSAALLVAGATNTNKVWNSSADPDMHINDQISSARDVSGVGVNSLYFAEAAWNLRWTSHRAQNTAGSNASAAMSLDQLGEMLGLPRRFKSMSRYQSSSSAKSTMLGSSKVLLFLAQDNAVGDVPTNIVNFWSPTESGERFRVLIAEFPKYYVVIVEHYSRPTLVSTLGIRQLTVAAA